MPEPQPVTILHIDDNEANRYVSARMLRSVGYEVIEAATGTDGLELATAQRPDLIILDVKLPDINGFEVCQRLKANSATAFIPVLHLSASFVDSKDKAQGLESGADAYLAQPVEPLELIATIRALLRMRRAEASVRFLAEASNVLATSLDYKTTLASLAHLVVPTLSEFCFFDLVTADEKIQRLVWQHADPTKQEWFDQVQGYIPPQSSKNDPVANVLLTGKASLVSEVTDAWMQSTAISAEHLQFMRDLRFCSLITVPLIIQNRRLGVLTCGLGVASSRQYTHADLMLIEDLCARASLALENARLYREAQETNRMKDEFLATLSHELRSPLNAMLGWAKLLNSRKFDEATTIRAIDAIERNARAQAQLVEDLLDVSRIIQGKFRLDVRPIELTTVIEAAIETVRPAADAKEIRLQTVLDPDAGPVAGDSNRLQQVIWNLVSNAIKFTPKRGRVHIRLERINSHVEIAIADTGQGINPNFVPYVFDRFRQADSSSTRSYSGLGLGLAIVRHLVELHGGTVRADSPGEGQGATFTVKLPLIPVRVEVNSPDRVHPTVGQGVPFDNPPSLAGVRVLVVDDETDVREFVTIVLEQCGATVVAVASVAEAIVTVSQLSVDILVSDIGMPYEDGYSLIRQVRTLKQGGQIPAIALTAYARVEDRTRAIAEGFQMHLPKPVEPAELVTVVASLSRGTVREM